jgi:hypothetical protein
MCGGLMFSAPAPLFQNASQPPLRSLILQHHELHQPTYSPERSKTSCHIQWRSSRIDITAPRAGAQHQNPSRTWADRPLLPESLPEDDLVSQHFFSNQQSPEPSQELPNVFICIQ